MAKGLIGVFVSLLVAVAVVGTISWSMNGKSHQMVVESSSLESLIDLQREANRTTLYLSFSE